MKKLLIGIMFLITNCVIIAQENKESSAIEVRDNNELALNENVDEVELLPSEHAVFDLTIDNQADLMRRLLEEGGKNVVIQFFLSLKNHNETKALELLSKKDYMDIIFAIFENLPINKFVELLQKCMEEIEAKPIEHWWYDPSDKEIKSQYIMPNVKAQVYIQFFMQYNALEKERSTYDILTRTNTLDENILKKNGQRMAVVLNTMPEQTVLDILYGRADSLIVKDDSYKLIPGNSGNSDQIIVIKINAKEYCFIGPNRYVLTNSYYNSFIKTKSRVPADLIKYIIPYLEPKLAVAILKEETKGDIKVLKDLITSIGCDKVYDELFVHLEDDVKNKVYETCKKSGSLLKMLGINPKNQQQYKELPAPTKTET